MKLNLKKKPVKNLSYNNINLQKDLTRNIGGGAAETGNKAKCHTADWYEH
ncbi:MULTISPECIES: hypothetical protein [unclassified Pseudoalteromonas]|nr:hypothetical protein [Pseudoalteromonas sp. XMcav2-N]MCO7187149.1 hypothetical protein [Pseudoalteromonas sp. XMcav2-N]